MPEIKVKTEEQRAAEQLRNIVEDRLMDWADEPLKHEEEEEEQDANILVFPVQVVEDGAGGARVSRVAGHADDGVRYQRCGGGRRIIRRTRGGE